MFVPFSDNQSKSLNFTLKKKPDRLIPLSLAPVVQIRGSQITTSLEYMSFDVKFPRFIGIRNDKSIDQVNTLSQISVMSKRLNGLMQIASDRANLSQPSKRRKTGRSIQTGHRGADLRHIQQENCKIFEDMTFWVVPKSAGYDPENSYLDQDKIKRDLEVKIRTYGGQLIQGSKEGLDNFLIVADHQTLRVKNSIKAARYDIVKSSYILDSIEKKKKLPLLLKYMIFCTEDTKRKMQQYSDEYGDSYMEDVTDDDVKYVRLTVIHRVALKKLHQNA